LVLEILQVAWQNAKCPFSSQKSPDDTPTWLVPSTLGLVSLLKTPAALRPGPGLETFPQGHSDKTGGGGKCSRKGFFTSRRIKKGAPSAAQPWGLKTSGRSRGGKNGGGGKNPGKDFSPIRIDLNFSVPYNPGNIQQRLLPLQPSNPFHNLLDLDH